MTEIGAGRYRFVEVSIYSNGGSGSTKTINWINGAIQKVAMTDDCTFTFTNPIVGVSRLFIINNDPLGPYSPSWPATVNWKDGTAPVLNKDKTVMCNFYYDGTNYFSDWGEYF
jgi:hypothetical protein